MQVAVDLAAASNRSVGLVPAVTGLRLAPDAFSSPLSYVTGLGSVFVELAAQPVSGSCTFLRSFAVAMMRERSKRM